MSRCSGALFTPSAAGTAAEREERRALARAESERVEAELIELATRDLDAVLGYALHRRGATRAVASPQLPLSTAAGTRADAT